MNKILIINGGQIFDQSKGQFNKMLCQWSSDFFKSKPNTEIKVVDINDDYTPEDEAKKFVWADFIIYHTPIWWFQVPFKLKEYFDRVLSTGYKNGIYIGDGRSNKNDNPKLGFGTGGLLTGKKYMLSTTWDAPRESFTVRSEFFNLQNVDEIMIGFHKMNKFIGLTKTNSIHFYDINQNITKEVLSMYHQAFNDHLERIYVSSTEDDKHQ